MFFFSKYQQKTLMKLNAQRSNKTPTVETGCLSDNQSTRTTKPTILSQSGTFFWGVGIG